MLLFEMFYVFKRWFVYCCCRSAIFVRPFVPALSLFVPLDGPLLSFMVIDEILRYHDDVESLLPKE